MSNPKHTPGPWTPDRTNLFIRTIRPKFDETEKVAELVHKRDAQLIAAAPEMLEALKAIKQQWDKGDDDPLGNDCISNKIFRAIAKAEGRNNE